MRREAPSAHVEDHERKDWMDSVEVVVDYFCDEPAGGCGHHFQAMIWVELPNCRFPQGVWMIYRGGKQVDKW
jgi:hypothetical protein